MDVFYTDVEIIRQESNINDAVVPMGRINPIDFPIRSKLDFQSVSLLLSEHVGTKDNNEIPGPNLRKLQAE